MSYPDPQSGNYPPPYPACPYPVTANPPQPAFNPALQGFGGPQYPPSQGYPPASYPPPGGYGPPQGGGYPPAQGGYPPAQGGYPANNAGFAPPPNQAAYPPSGGYQQTPAGYPPPGGYGAPSAPISAQPTAGVGAQDGWMTSPQARPVNCPPGLEYLTTIDQLLVHQKVELLEAADHTIKTLGTRCPPVSISLKEALLGHGNITGDKLFSHFQKLINSNLPLQTNPAVTGESLTSQEAQRSLMASGEKGEELQQSIEATTSSAELYCPDEDLLIASSGKDIPEEDNKASGNQQKAPELSDNIKEKRVKPLRLCGSARKRFKKLMALGKYTEAEAREMAVTKQTKELCLADKELRETIVKRQRTVKSIAKAVVLKKPRIDEERTGEPVSRTDITVDMAPKKSYKDVTKGIKIGVFSGILGEELDKDKLDLIQSSVLEAILKAQAPVAPRFHETVTRSGWLMLNCMDHETENWVKSHIASATPWAGANLITKDEKDFPKPHVFLAHFQDSVKEPTETILKFLSRQNKFIKPEGWKVLARNVMADEKTVVLVFVVDNTSAEILAKNPRLFFKLGTVLFTRRHTKSAGNNSKERRPDKKVTASQDNHPTSTDSMGKETDSKEASPSNWKRFAISRSEAREQNLKKPHRKTGGVSKEEGPVFPPYHWKGYNRSTTL